MRHYDIIDKLYQIGSFKFGSFTLKSGVVSPFYIDLRLIISYPELLNVISATLWNKLPNKNINRICGVPYTALPIATCISIHHNIPMLLKRKEAKDYGTKKIIEGTFEEGDSCVIIEDVITSGASILETIDPLQDAGVKVQDVLIIVDREQGGRMAIEKQGYPVHALFTITEITDFLIRKGKITEEQQHRIFDFIHSHQVPI